MTKFSYKLTPATLYNTVNIENNQTYRTKFYCDFILEIYDEFNFLQYILPVINNINSYDIEVSLKCELDNELIKYLENNICNIKDICITEKGEKICKLSLNLISIL